MNICVYGASSNAIDKIYLETAEKVGMKIAQSGHGIVFGGGASGVMGAVAKGADSFGGNIIGVAPSFFNVDGILYDNCTEFIYTDTMRERKQIMEDRSDAFIMMPGGIGTFEEFFEILTLKQLGRHGKAIAVYNCNGYYNDLQEMLDKAISQNFMKESCKNLCEFFVDIDKMISYIENYRGTVEKAAFFKNIDLNTRG